MVSARMRMLWPGGGLTALLVVWAVLLQCSLVRAQASRTWKVYHFPKDGFSVAKPPGTVGPKEEHVTVKSASGPLEAMSAKFLTADNTMFQVNANKCPPQLLKTLTDDQWQDFTLRNLEETVKSKFKNVRRITAGKVRGKAAEMDVDPGWIVRVRVFVSKNRVYEVLVTGPKNGAGAIHGTKFLDSFQIAGNQLVRAEVPAPVKEARAEVPAPEEDIRAKAPRPEKDGLFITVPNPITDRDVLVIKNKLEKAVKRRGKIGRDFTVVFDFNPGGLPSGTSGFGSCRDLAKYIRNLRLGQLGSELPAVHTIAFVHNQVTRHTVLPVLACGELVMSGEVDEKGPRARIGNVTGDGEPLDAVERQEYQQAAENFSQGLVFRMIDKNLVVRKVKMRDGVRYLSQEEIDKKKQAGEELTVEPGVPAGLEAGNTLYDPERALEYGLCKAMYNSRSELAVALKLPRHSLIEDLLADRTVVAWRIEVRGELDQGKLDSMRRRIKRALGKNANLIILQLECEGGTTVDAGSAARELSQLTDEQGLPVKTVAYVPPRRSLGAATYLALGCHEIVMARDAVLGDFNYLADKSPESLKPRRDMLVKLARDQDYPPLLFDAMLHPGLVLYRVQSKTDPSDYRLLTENELKKDAASAAPRYNQVGRIDSPPGELFKLNAKLAREWDVVQANDVESPETLYPLYNLEPGKVHVMRDDWLDSVAEFFREPMVNVILIMLGIIGLILELKMPGVALPGIVSAVCFVLFFWAYSFVGQFTFLAVLLFVLGLILLGVEIFILPGFGVTGISGVALVIGSLALVTLEKMPETSQDWLGLTGTLATFGMSLTGAIVAAFIIAWYLPSIPYANRLVLTPPGEGTNDGPEYTTAPSPHAGLLGAIGIAESTLRPAGKARFGDDFHDVIAEGDYIQPGSRVQVIEIEGTRIVVKEIS